MVGNKQAIDQFSYLNAVPQDDIPKYVAFYGLRAHDILNGKHVCCSLYIHMSIIYYPLCNR